MKKVIILTGFFVLAAGMAIADRYIIKSETDAHIGVENMDDPTGVRSIEIYEKPAPLTPAEEFKEKQTEKKLEIVSKPTVSDVLK